jgi:polysaccharide export outer membrane protein
LNDIVVLRRDGNGSQRAIRFAYKDVERGRSLDQNIVLNSGDVVVVP